MSLIHEALKKAEQQRHLGEAPTLNSPLFTRRRRRRWILPLVVLVVLATGSYLAWSLWPAGGLGTRLANQAAPAPSAVVPGDRAEQVREKLGSVPPYAHVLAATPADAGAKPATAQPPEHAIVAPPPVHAPSKPKPAQPATHKPAAKADTKTAPVTAVAAPPVPAQAAPPTKTIKPLADTPAPADHDQTGQPAAASTSSLPLYWQLPYAERKDLPELKISMHVFAANPADRFVILNGERQIEGDDLGNGLSLVEIRRGGIVVEMNGKRFIVPNAAGP